MKVYAGQGHQVLRDPDTAAASDVVAWIDARAADATAPVAMRPASEPIVASEVAHTGATLQVDEGARFDADGDATIAVGLRARLSYGAPLGWEGMVVLDRNRAMAYPAGIALRFARTGRVGLLAGAGLGPGEVPTAGGLLSLDVPMGARLTGVAVADASWRWKDGDHPAGLDVRARAGLRIGRHRRFGRSTYAGGGVSLLGVYERSEGIDLYGFAVGFDLDAAR
jgi:hypothetical protein